MTVSPMKFARLVFSVTSLFITTNVFADDACPTPLSPVVNVDLPSRYKDDDKSRSEIDDTLNAEVEKSLAPIDGFIRDLADMANKTMEESKAEAAADCIFADLKIWAKAGALTQAETMNAHLALSSRIAGIAATYARAQTVKSPPKAVASLVENWLAELAQKQVEFFDNEAPPMASRNNHRAWAGLAAAQVGAITKRQSLVDWGAKTNEMLICSANADGSLPEEMKWLDLELHFDRHGVAPLVATTRVLYPLRPEVLQACDGKLDKIVDFTIAALANPSIVAKLADSKQSFQTKKEKLRAFQIAWLEPYLYLQDNDQAAQDLANAFRPLSNSFLGGNLTRQYKKLD